MAYNSNNGGLRKVGIYIRVSSDVQGERSSPKEQEIDCIKYCEQRGYQIVEVYKDITSYRMVGRNGKPGKLVQPSGTRIDRPAFQRMIADARAGRINTILGWREDRLYRGMRPSLEILDLIDEMKGMVTVELVTETFDSMFASIKAAFARKELQDKNKRWAMGMKGRLKAGKGFATPPYGYGYDDRSGNFYIYEPEAQWVRLIYVMYADGYTIPEISKELIRQGAPQRMVNGGKGPWSTSVIFRILRREYYFTGNKTTAIEDQKFITKLDPIITDQVLWDTVTKRINGKKTHRTPTDHTKSYSTEWLAGLLLCKGHEYHMGQMQSSKGPAPFESYACRNKYRHQLQDHPQCGGFVPMGWLDRYVWKKLFDFICDPELFQKRLQERIAQLREKQDFIRASMDSLQAKMDDIKMQRVRLQKMYTKGYIKDEDMDQQMAILQAEEDDVMADVALADTDYSSDLAAVEEVANLFRSQLAESVINLAHEPTECKEFAKWTNAVKRTIRAIVSEVVIDNEWNVEIKTHMDITKPLYVGLPTVTDIFTAVEESGWQEAE